MESENINKSAMKAGVWFIACNIIQRGIQFLYTPIYSRALSTDGYGKYASFLAWESILSVFATLNLASAVFNKGMVKYEKYGEDFTFSMYGLSGMTSIVTAGAFFVIYRLMGSKFRLSETEILLLFVVMHFKMVIQLWSSKERFNFRYKMLLVVTITTSLLNPVASLLIYKYIKPDYFSMEIGYALSNFVIGIILIICAQKPFRNLFNHEYWRFSLIFVVPLIPHYLSNVILYQSDRLMIGYYCDDSSVGIYTLAYQLAFATSIVFTALNNALVPWLYRKLKKRSYETVPGVICIAVALIFSASMCLVIVSPELIYILGSSKFESSVGLVAPLVISTCLMFVNTLILDILFFYDRNKIIMFATTSGAIVNLVLNYIMLPRLGFEIAAYTTIAGYAVILIINMIDLLVLNIGFKYFDFRTVLIMLIGILAIIISDRLLYISSLIRWFVAICFMSMVLFCFYKLYFRNRTIDRSI